MVAQDGVRKGTISPQAASKYLVPLARANAEHCILLIENLGTTKVSVRQMERLYRDWRRADAEQKRKLVEHPLLYLKAQQVLANDHVEALDEPELISDLRLISRSCHRVRRRLAKGESEMLGVFSSLLEPTWRTTRYAFEELSQTMPNREE